jgi:Zn-dependent peptidase ImmA (M78 family)
VLGYTEVQTVDEAIVWILSHEMFHYLRQTRQVEGRNTEIEADKFADEHLCNLRRLRARWKTV